MTTPSHCCNCGANQLVLEIAEGQDDATGLDEEIIRYRCLNCQRHFTFLRNTSAEYKFGQ